MRNSSTNQVAIVVLNWNGLSDTLSCISSLENSKFDSFDIIVVDNGSTEAGTVTRIKERISKSRVGITLLTNDKNLGFSGGVNTGIRHALAKKYEYIALINNDAVVEPSWLVSLLDGFKNNDSIGLVTGSLLHMSKDTIDSTGEIYSIWGLPFPRLRNRPASTLPESGYVFGATGGATMYRREVFESVGLFDEIFFAYYEDVDISFRAQLFGWKVYYTNDAVAYHTQGASSSKISGFTTKQAIRNLPLLFIKNVPAELFFAIGIRFWFAYALIVVKALFGPHFKQAFSGWVEGTGLFLLKGLSSRSRVQRTNKVDTTYLKSILFQDLPPDQVGLRRLLGRKVQ